VLDCIQGIRYKNVYFGTKKKGFGMISGRINIASLNRNHRIIINNTEEIKADLKQLKQVQNQANVGRDVKDSCLTVGNGNTVTNVHIHIDELLKLKRIEKFSKPLSEILNMIYSDIKRYENSDNINYIKRALNKWQKSIRFLHSISKNELKNPPLTKKIDKLISKMSPKYYRDITEYLTKTCSSIKNDGIKQALFQIDECHNNVNVLYDIAMSIIMEIETIRSVENGGD